MDRLTAGALLEILNRIAVSLDKIAETTDPKNKKSDISSKVIDVKNHMKGNNIMKAEIKFDRSEFKSEEKMIGGVEFTVKVGFTGNVYINGKYYRQLCFTPNQVALVVEDFLNGVPADNDDDKEENNDE